MNYDGLHASHAIEIKSVSRFSWKASLTDYLEEERKKNRKYSIVFGGS